MHIYIYIYIYMHIYIYIYILIYIHIYIYVIPPGLTAGLVNNDAHNSFCRWQHNHSPSKTSYLVTK